MSPMEFKAGEGRCEEAALISSAVYIPCNQPATKVLHCNRDKRFYRMCDFCADHNILRGMKFVRRFEQ